MCGAPLLIAQDMYPGAGDGKGHESPAPVSQYINIGRDDRIVRSEKV